MEPRLKNIIFISICEACLLYYRKNKDMSTFSIWCNYQNNYITNNITGNLLPKNIIKIQFFILDYLEEIYGFSDIESFSLIYDFFKEEKWDDLYEIANYTLFIQTHLRLS